MAGIWLRITKRSAEQSVVSYTEAVENAFCYGWIDGQKQAENEHYWLQRFTPRTAENIWSKTNTVKAEVLITAGRMRPAGLRTVELTEQDGRQEVAYSSAGTSTAPDDPQQALDANPKAR